MFDREAVFIESVLKPLLERVSDLRVVLEHITTEQAVRFVESAPLSVAATVTPQHMLYNRNALFQVCCSLLPKSYSVLEAGPSGAEEMSCLQGGLQPHSFCLPILKRERHRQAVAAAAMSGSRKFFLGTDSAPHARETKVHPLCLQAYAHVGALCLPWACIYGLYLTELLWLCICER